jgi:hypothetical protein
VSWWRKSPKEPPSVPAVPLDDPSPKIEVLREAVASDAAKVEKYREMVDNYVRGIRGGKPSNG